MKRRAFCFWMLLLFGIIVSLQPLSAVGQKSVNTVASSEVADSATTSRQMATAGTHTDTVVGYPLSDTFRRAVVHIPDEIEGLRTAMRERLVVRGVRFDEIDTQLEQSRRYVGSQGDLNVYYALFHANHLLAMSFYKRLANASEDEVAEGQLESVTCTLESKFALLKGVLYAGIQDCSILSKVNEGQDTKEQPETRPATESARVSYPLQPLVIGSSHSPNTFQSLACELTKSEPPPNNSGQVTAQSTAASINHPTGIKTSIETVVRHTFQILGGGSSDQSSH